MMDFQWTVLRMVKKEVYGLEPPGGEFTTTECAVNYH